MEVLLTIRPQTMRFMGGAAVFPGGAVSPADNDPRWIGSSTMSENAAAALLGEEDPAAALGWFVAGIRESFEEVGLLLAEGRDAMLVREDASDPETFLDRCLSEGVVLATDRLIPGGRWVTPVGSPVRFDARFFLARVPDGWEPVPDPSEVEACHWLTPKAALERMAASELLLAPPTIEMLQRLEEFTTVEGALDGLKGEGVGSGRVLGVRLSPVIRIVLAPNPGIMTGPGTNTYVVGTGPVVVIDPAISDEEYIDAVIGTDQVAQILVTHRHPDHVGGVQALVERTGAPVRAFGSDPAGGVDVEPLGDGTVIEAHGASLLTLFTPGHSSDHLSFLMEDEATLFAGDNVAGEGTAVIAPPDGNMGDYLASLERLRSFKIDRIYPGHFRPLERGNEVLDGYIRHRAARERAILDAMGDDDALTPEEIVAAVYTDTPVALHPIAVYSVVAHLELVEAQAKVERVGDRWRLVRKAARE